MAARKRQRKPKPTWGGEREGSGRTAMFDGPRVKVTIKVTERAFAAVQETVAELEPKHGSTATVSAAFEHLVRKARRLPLSD